MRQVDGSVLARRGIVLCVLFVLAAFAAQPAAAATQAQFASSWAVNNNADWTPFPPNPNPLGPPNDFCTGTSTPTGDWADFSFPAFSIPGGETVNGVEVRFKYLSQSGSNTAQLKSGGSLVGATRTVPQAVGTASCDHTFFVSAGGMGDLWGTGLTTADFNAGTVSVRITQNANTVDIDAVELVVHYGPVNSPPTAEAGGPYTVGEGGSVALDGSGSSDPDEPAGGLLYEWDLDGDAVFGEAGETGPTPTFSAAGLDGPAMKTVTLRVTDAGALSDTDTATVTVENVAPAVDAPAVSPEPSDEGQGVTATAAFQDPAAADTFTCTVDYGDGSGPAAGTAAGGTCTGPAHVYADDGPYTVTVTVTDDDGGSGQNDATHGVENVAPTITTTGSSAELCGDTPEDGQVEVSADFSDPGFDSAAAGTLEDFTDSTIDWGDGTVEPATVDETPGAAGTPTTGTVSGSHTYAGGGVFTVTVTVADDDGGTDTESFTVYVTGAGLVGGELQVVGTGFEDTVNIQTKKNGIEVHAGFLGAPGKATFPAAAVTSLRVAVCGGDDEVHVNRDVAVPAVLEGGAGNDHLRAGSGATVLEGGEGDDVLHAGPAGDVLLGGDGADQLFGRGGDDLLDGGLGDDELHGNHGDDGLDGGPGLDLCQGEPGTDVTVGCEL
ncbi:MAG TPA: PKD domain-containing protein [Thermoanaerobaculia bacterium]